MVRAQVQAEARCQAALTPSGVRQHNANAGGNAHWLTLIALSKTSSKKTPTTCRRSSPTRTNKRASTVASRAGGLWTEARYWSFIRSALRRTFVRWPPNYQARNAARKPYCGPAKNQKWEYECAMCKGWFPMKATQLDHINPCGQLKSAADLEGFVTRLFCEADGLRVLCKPCHKTITDDAARLLREAKSTKAGGTDYKADEGEGFFDR